MDHHDTSTSLEQTIRAERARLVRWMTKLTGDIHAAEDIVQDALLIAWNKQATITDPSGTDKWLNAITYNVYRRWAFARGRTAQRESEVDLTAQHDTRQTVELEHDELAHLLDRALDLLPSQTREMFIARYLEEMPQSQVAARFRMSESAFGGVAVIGNAIFGIWGETWPRHATYISGFIAASMYLVAFSLFPPFWMLVLVVAIVGIIAAPINPIISTVMYERVPVNMRARVFGLLSSGVQIAMPFGALEAGYLIEGVGLRTTVIGMTMVYVSVALCMLLLPILRQMNRVPDTIPDLKPADSPPGSSPTDNTRHPI